MASFFDELNEKHQAFIDSQKIFFVATADQTGRINLSPKGYDSLKVLTPRRLIWLNLTGSGNETAAHLLKVNRMTLMFCAFDGPPMILRIYGSANVVHPHDAEWDEFHSHFGQHVGSRQIFAVDVDSVQTSCGFGVPKFSYDDDRPTLLDHANKKGPDGIQAYWKEKNVKSIDGLETGILGQ